MTDDSRRCSIAGCDGPHKGRGYCNKHLIRYRRYGDPLMVRGFASIEERFWAKVDKDGPIPEVRTDLGPCWVWTASTGNFGYGQFYPGSGGRTVQAYRWAYEHFVGPVPKGMEPDHLCRNVLCVNYDRHLEVVTKAENILRGEAPPAQNARKTHCHRGHLLTEENVYRRKDRVGRDCRRCRAERRK